MMVKRGAGGRVVRALALAALRSTLCGVVGSSPIAARSRGLPHHRGDDDDDSGL